MIASYRADTDLTLLPELLDADSNPIPAVSATYSLYGESELLVAAQPVDLYSFEVPQLVVAAIFNELPPGELKSYRRVDVDVIDEAGKSHLIEIVYFVVSGESLQMAVNSFASLPTILVTASEMIHMKVFHFAKKEDQVSALVQAWNNLGQLPVRFEDLQGTDSYEKGSTRELIDLDIKSLSPKTFARLVRAQIIEADDVLGGNPIEARRRLGLISDSAGESAHFFRTSKPLNLPCSRAAIDELRGIVNWSISIGRG
jgi:hypothetical protein